MPKNHLPVSDGVQRTQCARLRQAYFGVSPHRLALTHGEENVL